MAQSISYSSLLDNVGRIFGPTDPIVLGQHEINTFADVTNDHQWVHVNVDRATEELGGTLAHGYLVLALIPQFTAQLITFTDIGHGLNYGLGRVRFTAPVPSGSRLTATQEIVRVEDKAGGKLITSTMTISIVGQQRPACVAEIMVLVFHGDGSL